MEGRAAISLDGQPTHEDAGKGNIDNWPGFGHRRGVEQTNRAKKGKSLCVLSHSGNGQ